MQLRLGQIEEVLKIVHRVDVSDQSRFRAKLRNLSRVGLSLPSGGKGRKANYHHTDLFKIALAVELLQVGIPPEAASVSVNHHWTDAVKALFAARKERQEGRPGWRYFVAEPHALDGPLYIPFREKTAREISVLLGVPSPGAQRLIVINLTQLLVTITNAAPGAGIDADQLAADLDQDQEIILTEGARKWRQ